MEKKTVLGKSLVQLLKENYQEKIRGFSLNSKKLVNEKKSK